MTTKQELQLVEDAKQNLEAFNKLYEYYFDRIYSFCLNRLPLQQTAEDVTSEVFVAAVKALPRFDTSLGFRFGTWLYRVAHNKIADYYRKHRLSTIEDFDVIIDEEQSAEAEAYRDETQRQVVRVLLLIKPRYQEIISYKFYAELEHAEIAEVMKIKHGQVKVLLHRALQSFKKVFGEMYPETETFTID